jgi:hypothetical protein
MFCSETKKYVKFSFETRLGESRRAQTFIFNTLLPIFCNSDERKQLTIWRQGHLHKQAIWSKPVMPISLLNRIQSPQNSVFLAL